MSYQKVFTKWQTNPEQFWLEAAQDIDWVKAPVKALNGKNAPIYEWFTDSLVNGCYNAVDRHVVAGRGDQVAIIHDSPVTGTKRAITYS